MALSGIQRTFADILDSIWGKDAQTSIPTQPVSGIAYRDTDAEFESGQKYDSLGESSRWNQMLYLLTGLMSELTAFGILPWSAAQPYSKGALCIGSDGTLWQAQIDIAASPTNPVPPGTDDNVWSRPKISGFVPDSIRVIAGTGMTGGGPLSADVTLAAKLTDSVSSTDSTTAASATAVKTAYDAAQAKLPLGGGVMTGSIQINDPANVIGSAPSTDLERGMFLGDKNSVIMGGFDVIQRASDNAKYTQFYSKNSSGHITSLAAVTYEDGTRELVADSPLQINDIQIKQVVDGGRRVIVLSGARGKEGYSFRFSPDTGEAYMDGRVIHAKADTAGYADTAGSAPANGGTAWAANRLRLTEGGEIAWSWTGQGGQPQWLWGGNDGVNMRVYNPANFSVNYANSAGQAQLAAPAVQWVVNTSGPAITVPQGGTYNVVCICFNDSGGKGAVKHYPNIAGGTVIPNAPTDYMVAGLCARVA